MGDGSQKPLAEIAVGDEIYGLSNAAITDVTYEPESLPIGGRASRPFALGLPMVPSSLRAATIAS